MSSASFPLQTAKCPSRLALEIHQEFLSCELYCIFAQTFVSFAYTLYMFFFLLSFLISMFVLYFLNPNFPLHAHRL